MLIRTKYKKDQTSEGNRPLGRPGCQRGWSIILKWMLKEVGCEMVVWIYLATIRIARFCENGNEHSGFGSMEVR
jgi:hypothetical protein